LVFDGNIARIEPISEIEVPDEPVAKPVIYKKLSTEKTWFFRLVP
jgi:hypothetical protein